ncbi:serine/threonine-protein phosphatase 4 regulatory subunit 4-like [Babylonia areolata]|uniref:serine/threonine-protein phosphatase 4 regulatory subunit 4-like n=1 Tax=Babylonia areolata TaxID=304850 RepID=UPI003FD5488B
MSGGSMEDLEVFPRQAVIVKNGKIFVEDEPFFCSSSGSEEDDDNDNDKDASDDKPAEDITATTTTSTSTTTTTSITKAVDDGPEELPHQDSNSKSDDDDGDGNDTAAVVDFVDDDEFESEKENRFHQYYHPHSHHHHHHHHHYHHHHQQRGSSEDENDEEEVEEEEEDGGSDDGDEDEEEEERFVRFLGRRGQELLEEVDGVRVTTGSRRGVTVGAGGGIGGGLLLQGGEYDEGLPPEGVRLPAVPPPEDMLDDPVHYLDYFSSGQEVQRISVITALPSLLKENNAECMRRVVPKVREVLYVAQQDMQLAAASAFLQILQDKLVPLSSYTHTFLQTILTSVDSKDPEVSAAWLGTLLDVIDLLPTEIIKKDILGIAINKGQLQQPVPVRLSCCKILGKIATKFESFLIKKEILPVVQQLCQDVEHEVRACMCCQLDSVARGLGLEDTKSAILPELVELTNDEESDVRVSGLRTVVSVLPILDTDTLTTTIVPLVCKMCQKAMQAEDCTLPVVAKHLGQLCHGLHSNLTDEQKHWFVDYFKKLCRVGLPDKQKAAEKNALVLSSCDEEDGYIETRRCAAYNFPAMALFVGTKSFKGELLGTLTSLCRDPHFIVRKTIASGFHEVSKMLGNMVTMLFPDLIMLLKDESIEVLEGVVPSFPCSLEVLSRTASTLSEAKLHAVQEVVGSFLGTESVVFACNKWRLQEDMMGSLGVVAKLCSQDLLFGTVVPLLLAKMKHGRALPVRHAAARSLLMVMRCLHRLEWREHVVHTLIQDFCHGRSCHSRALFIVVCRYVIELCSKAFFKEHFFDYALALTSDPVPNIRMRMVCLLPALKRLIKLPQDNGLKGSLEQCVRRVLVNEKDRDVIAVMKQAVEELDGIHVQMESMVYQRKNVEEDSEDRAKEEEEKQLLELEEQERREEERSKKNSSKKDGSKLPGLRKTASLGKGQAGGGAKADIPQARKDSKVPPSTATSQSVCNGSSSSGTQGPPSLLPHMIKSKSTTSIPSLSHIPRPEARPSTPPRKELGSTRIPVYHSLPRSASALATGGGSSLNKQKGGPPASQRTGNIPSNVSLISNQQRKGSAGSLPTSTAARRGSLGSAGSTNSEPSTARAGKPRANTTSGATSTTLPVPRGGRKVTKP